MIRQRLINRLEEVKLSPEEVEAAEGEAGHGGEAVVCKVCGGEEKGGADAQSESDVEAEADKE